MPHGDTDIPHIAFTHHRIRSHPTKSQPDAGRIPELVPISDVSQLPPIDQKRNLGLAYLQIATEGRGPDQGATYRQRARHLLESVHDAKLRDGATAEALARINWTEQNFERAAAFAQEALDTDDLPAEERAFALLILANCRVREGKTATAIGLLEKLTQLRRNAEDWRLLGFCHLEQNEPRKALRAFEQALTISPFRFDLHEVMAETYRRVGDDQRSKEHQEKAKWLIEHLPQ
jgi:tetratricopeptide (TPR) repeat protein